MADDDFNFEERANDVDAQRVFLNSLADIVVPMFKTFTRHGLSAQEAAALTAAYWAQNVSVTEGPEPPNT